jgi:hypothetical protein
VPGKVPFTRTVWYVMPLRNYVLRDAHFSISDFSELNSNSTPGGILYISHRLRLEKLLYLELSRNSSGFFKPLLIQVAVSLLKLPHGGFRSEAAVTKSF